MGFIEGFTLGFGSSLLASLVLWYLTVILPRKRDQTNIAEHTRTILNGIIGQGIIVFNTLLRSAEIDRDFKSITLKDIKELGPKIKLRTEAPPIVGFYIIKGVNYAQYLVFYKDRTVADLDRMFIYIHFLESQLVKHLNTILHSEYFQLCDVWLKNVERFTDPDMTSFDGALYEYYNAIRSLESYCK